MSTVSEAVEYKGVVPFAKSTDVLNGYFALLFPTYYQGEGFAGTLIDAMAAGIPVIASDWRYNSEVVESGVNGYLYKPGNLEYIVRKTIEQPMELLQMKENCLKKAHEYTTEAVMKNILTKIC